MGTGQTLATSDVSSVIWSVFLQSKGISFSVYPTSALISPFRRGHILGQFMRDEKLLALKYPRKGNTGGHWFTAPGAVWQRREIQKQRSKNPTWNSYLPFIICFLLALYAVIFASTLKGERGKLCWCNCKQVAAGRPGLLLLWELTQIICLFRLIFLVHFAQNNAIWQSKCARAAVN